MSNDDIRNKIIEQALKDIPFDGWKLDTFRNAARIVGEEDMAIDALFPQGVHDTLKAFSHWADEKMLERLNAFEADKETMRMRDRVQKGVEVRLEILALHKDCVRESAKLLASPRYARLATSLTWQTADIIWNWAGDTATDYNRYTKRGLLCGVIGSTTLYWLQDDSENFEKTRLFLSRRIENVLFIGKNASVVIKPVASMIQSLMMRRKAV